MAAGPLQVQRRDEAALVLVDGRHVVEDMDDAALDGDVAHQGRELAGVDVVGVAQVAVVVLAADLARALVAAGDRQDRQDAVAVVAPPAGGEGAEMVAGVHAADEARRGERVEIVARGAVFPLVPAGEQHAHLEAGVAAREQLLFRHVELAH